MAVRIPLVIISGSVSQLPSGDSIAVGNPLTDLDYQGVYNNSGSTIAANTFVRIANDSGGQTVPDVRAVSSLGTQETLGFLTAALATGTKAYALRRGKITVTGFNTSAAAVGDPVYCTAAGALTLTRTFLVVGLVLIPNANGTVWLDVGLADNRLGRPRVERVTTQSGTNPYWDTTSASYAEVVSFEYQGTDNVLPLTRVAAVTSSANNTNTMDVRLQDITNALTIAEVTGVTHAAANTKEIHSLGTISNLPTGGAIFQVQLRRPTGAGQVRIFSMEMES